MKLAEWLHQIPTDLDGVNVRELAVKNYDPKFVKGKIDAVIDFETALCCAFDFKQTRQVNDFWYNISRKLRGMKPIDKQIKLDI